MNIFKLKKQCWLCGEYDYLKSYIDVLSNYGSICNKCIQYLEIENKPRREKANKKYEEQRRKKQLEWRKARDK